MKRIIIVFLCLVVPLFGQTSKTPINNGILQSDLNAAGYKILSANLSDYAGANMSWNVVTGKFDSAGGGGGGGGSLGSVIDLKADYGATGNGIQLNDAVMTSGASTLASASTPFTSGDIGKIVVIAGAGTSAVDLRTTISGFTDSGHVTLATTAGTSVSGAVATYGTDDTAAIQSAINAASALSSSKIFAAKGIYMVGGALQTTGGIYNAQIKLPNRAQTLPAYSLIFEGEGPAPAPYLQYPLTAPFSTFGTLFFSTVTGSGVRPSMIGGPQLANAVFSNYNMVIRNITCRTYYNPQLTMLDLFSMNTAVVENVTIDTDRNVYNIPSAPTVASSAGLMVPKYNNEARTLVNSVYVAGYYQGIHWGEHANGDDIFIQSCVHALEFDFAYHPSYIKRATLGQCTYNLWVTDTHYFSIDQLDLEHGTNGGPGWQDTVEDLHDPLNKLYGRAGFHAVTASIGVLNTFTKSGGTNFYESVLATGLGATNAFGTLTIAGQSNVVADAAPDTLTLVAGSNVTLTTNATTDTVTIAATGGGGSGTVTSIAATTPIVVSPSPIIGTGTISLDATKLSNWDTAYTDRLKWDGGTGAWFNATTAKTSLGLTIGTNVQAWDTDLDVWATKTPYAGSVIVTTGKTFTSSNTLTLAGTDGSTLTIGGGGTLGTAAYTASSAYQAADADLTTFAGITPTTVGQSFLTLANPGAITFPEISATNVVSAKTAAQLKTDLSLTATDVGLGSVTNNAQTQAAIVPNTAPSAGQILIGNAGNTAYAKNSLSGSGATMSLGATGVLTISAIPESSLSITNVTTGDATTSAHGFAPKGTVGTTQFWRQDWTLATPGGGGNVSSVPTPTSGQLALWTGSTTIQGLTALPAANFPALTGDVTTTAGSLTTNIATNAVTLGDMATIATDSILGRATASIGNVEVLGALPWADTGDVTRAADGKVTTLANIPLTTTIAGAAGAQGDVLYYGATGWAKLAAGTNGNQLTTHGAAANPTWDAPGSGGGGTPAGATTNVQFNDAGAFGGEAGFTYSKATTDGCKIVTTGTGGAAWYMTSAGSVGAAGYYPAQSFSWYNAGSGTVPLTLLGNNFYGNSATIIGWSGSAGGAIDTGFYRNAAGIVEVNNGTAGQYRDIKVRTITHNGYTVATLPTGVAGMTAYVTDGTASLAWGATVTGGASTKYLVWYNGANWTVAGK